MGDPPGSAGPLWAGGFAEGPDPGMWAYTSSLAVDRRLWRQDIAGSRAHARGLVGAGVLEVAEGKLLLDGLAKVAGELDAGAFAFLEGDEDVHSAVERRLTALVVSGQHRAPPVCFPGTLAEARRIPLCSAARAIQAQSRSGRLSNDGGSFSLSVMQMVRNRTYGAVGRKRQGRKPGFPR